MSTVNLNLGKANWYVTEPDFSCKLAEQLTARQTVWKKARIILSLPTAKTVTRRVATVTASTCLVLAVTGLGVLFVA